MVGSVLQRAQFCSIYNKIIGRAEAKLVTDESVKITPDTYGYTDIPEDAWYYEVMLRATSAYDDNGFVDPSLRGIRNDLDDYNG